MKLKRKILTFLIGIMTLFSGLAVTIGTLSWFTLNPGLTPNIPSSIKTISSYFDSNYEPTEEYPETEGRGDGSLTNPYVITKPVHFYNLMRLSNSGNETVQQQLTSTTYFQMGKKLDSTDPESYYFYNFTDENRYDTTTPYSSTLNMKYYENEFNVINSSSSNPFRSQIIGNDLSIGNLNVTSQVDIDNYGVFGYVDHNASISDLSFENLTINVTENGSATNYVGLLAGAVEQKYDSESVEIDTFSNCFVKSGRILSRNGETNYKYQSNYGFVGRLFVLNGSGIYAPKSATAKGTTNSASISAHNSSGTGISDVMRNANPDDQLVEKANNGTESEFASYKVSTRFDNENNFNMSDNASLSSIGHVPTEYRDIKHGTSVSDLQDIDSSAIETSTLKTYTDSPGSYWNKNSTGEFKYQNVSKQYSPSGSYYSWTISNNGDFLTYNNGVLGITHLDTAPITYAGNEQYYFALKGNDGNWISQLTYSQLSNVKIYSPHYGKYLNSDFNFVYDSNIPGRSISTFSLSSGTFKTISGVGIQGGSISASASTSFAFAGASPVSPDAYKTMNRDSNEADIGPSIAATSTFNKITSTDELESGMKYLIVCEGKADILDGSSVSDGSEVISVTISNNTISIDEKYAFTITAASSGYKITGSNGKTIGHTGSKNTLNTGDSYTNSITINSGTASIGCNNRYLKRNSSNVMFRYYTSGQTGIQLYKQDSGTPPSPTYVTGISLDPTSMNLTVGGATQTITPTLTPINPTTSTITWSSSNNNVATVSNGVVNPVGVGTATITAVPNGRASGSSLQATCSVTVSAAPAPSEEYDMLTLSTTDRPATSSYGNWSGKTSNTSAVYAGNSAGDHNSIQLRSSNNSGIVQTTSGGKVLKITVVWNSSTSSGRTLQIYGKNTAYTDATDLYGDNKGTLLGSIVYGTSTELTISGDYDYIGMRSQSNAMYLTSIKIEYKQDTPPESITIITDRYTLGSNDSIKLKVFDQDSESTPVTFEITSRSGDISSADCYIDSDNETLKVKNNINKNGIVTVKATSTLDENVTTTRDYYIIGTVTFDFKSGESSTWDTIYNGLTSNFLISTTYNSVDYNNKCFFEISSSSSATIAITKSTTKSDEFSAQFKQVTNSAWIKVECYIADDEGNKVSDSPLLCSYQKQNIDIKEPHILTIDNESLTIIKGTNQYKTVTPTITAVSPYVNTAVVTYAGNILTLKDSNGSPIANGSDVNSGTVIYVYAKENQTGSEVITFSANGDIKTCSVSVINPITDFDLTKTSGNQKMLNGDSITLTACNLTKGESGSDATNPYISWTISKSNYLEITEGDLSKHSFTSSDAVTLKSKNATSDTEVTITAKIESGTSNSVEKTYVVTIFSGLGTSNNEEQHEFVNENNVLTDDIYYKNSSDVWTKLSTSNTFDPNTTIVKVGDVLKAKFQTYIDSSTKKHEFYSSNISGASQQPGKILNSGGACFDLVGYGSKSASSGPKLYEDFVEISHNSAVRYANVGETTKFNNGTSVFKPVADGSDDAPNSFVVYIDATKLGNSNDLGYLEIEYKTEDGYEMPCFVNKNGSLVSHYNFSSTNITGKLCATLTSANIDDYAYASLTSNGSYSTANKNIYVLLITAPEGSTIGIKNISYAFESMTTNGDGFNFGTKYGKQQLSFYKPNDNKISEISFQYEYATNPKYKGKYWYSFDIIGKSGGYVYIFNYDTYNSKLFVGDGDLSDIIGQNIYKYIIG